MAQNIATLVLLPLMTQIPADVYWPEGAKWQKQRLQSVAQLLSSKHFSQLAWMCGKAPSVPGASKHLSHHSCSLWHCDDNGTLNQCFAPPGFIIGGRPIVVAQWQHQMAAEGGGGVREKVRQMVLRDDNDAISQRMLHLWRDGGCC